MVEVSALSGDGSCVDNERILVMSSHASSLYSITNAQRKEYKVISKEEMNSDV